MESGWKKDLVPFRARIVRGFRSAIYGANGRRGAGRVANVARGGGILFAGRRAFCIRSESEMAGSVEALSGRADNGGISWGFVKVLGGERGAGRNQILKNGVEGG